VRRYSSLRRRREFALVLRRGRPATTKSLSVFALKPASPGDTKVGIVITAKVGNAVERNRLRRRCKAIIDETNVSGMWLVILCRPDAKALGYGQLRQELRVLLAESSRRAGDGASRRESSEQ
jgi:ribonuclease P protein component